jgi:hypothetical protein
MTTRFADNARQVIAHTTMVNVALLQADVKAAAELVKSLSAHAS